MIIGVALVVDDIHKGQRLAFRYPESVPSSVINSNDQLLKFHEEYLSMSPDNFARLFRPKHSMLNKVMEIIIEDLQYISFPMPCSNEFLNLSSSSSVHDDLSMFNVVIATVRENALRRIRNRPSTTENARRKPGEDPVAELLGLSNQTLSLTKETLHRLLVPCTSLLTSSPAVSVVEKFTRALLNQEKRIGYVSQEVNLIFRILEESDRFLSTPQSPSAASTERRDRTSSFAEGFSMNSSTNNCSAHNSTGTPSHTESEVQANKKLTLCEFVLQQSSLANELRGLYHSLVGGYCVSLTVNGVLSLNIPLLPHLELASGTSSQRPASSEDETRNPKSTDMNPKKKSTQEQLPGKETLLPPPIQIDQSPQFYQRDPHRLFPFHSFLAVADAEELSDIMNKLGCTFNTTLEAPPLPSYLPEKTIPISTSPVLNSLRNRAMAAGCLVSNSDLSSEPVGTFSNSQPSSLSIVGLTGPVCSHQCSPLVNRILTSINPTVSFAELRNTLDCSMEEIYAVVNHLSLWGLGEVICPLSDESLFQINPEFPLANETTADGYKRKIGQKAARAFSTTFNGTDINLILAAFTGSTTLKDAIETFPKKLKPYGVDMVIWLMRRHIIRELQFYFIDPSLCQSLSSSGLHNSPHQLSHSQQSSPRLDHNNLNNLRHAYQNPTSGSFPSSAYSSYSSSSNRETGSSRMMPLLDPNAAFFDLKKRLEKYFDGMTPLCEILWLEDDHQITIEKLFIIVKKFHIVINIRP